MKVFVLVCVLFVSVRVAEAGAATEQRLLHLRSMFYSAKESSEMADALVTETDAITEATPILFGYKAMSDMMQANHSFNPFSKLKYFNLGREKLERAIFLAPESVELRFLRFAVQSKAPSMLGYSDNISGDKTILLRYVDQQRVRPEDTILLHHIAEFLSTCELCSDQERMQMSTVASQFKP